MLHYLNYLKLQGDYWENVQAFTELKNFKN